jgi:hypothetical protein
MYVPSTQLREKKRWHKRDADLPPVRMPGENQADLVPERVVCEIRFVGQQDNGFGPSAGRERGG